MKSKEKTIEERKAENDMLYNNIMEQQKNFKKRFMQKEKK